MEVVKRLGMGKDKENLKSLLNSQEAGSLGVVIPMHLLSPNNCVEAQRAHKFKISKLQIESFVRIIRQDFIFEFFFSSFKNDHFF